MSKNVLRTGDRDTIVLRFIRHPEYIRIGTKMIFREGRTKAVGTIYKIIPHTSPSLASAHQLQKMTRMRSYTNKQKLRTFLSLLSFKFFFLT